MTATAHSANRRPMPAVPRDSLPLVIRNAARLDQAGRWDIVISDGRVTQIVAGRAAVDAEEIDAAGGLVTRSFVEPHFHPDKALTRKRMGPVSSGDALHDTMRRAADIKRASSQADVKARASEAITLAVSHGIGAMRAQVDVDTVSGLTGMKAMLEVRADFADVIDLQLVAFPQEGIVRDPGAAELLSQALELGADLVGGGPTNEDSPEHYPAHLTALFDLAQSFDVPLDIHVDMREDPEQRTLELLARETLARGYAGRVNASHCCALAAYPDAYAHEVIELIASAGIQICICPMANLLIPTGERTERGRGASRPKELLDAGINVAAGSDNLHDTWFRFGRLDPVQLALITCLSAGMRTDEEVREAFAMTTTRAAQYASLPADEVQVGSPADLVIFSEATLDDVLRGAEGRRITLKRGRVVGGSESRAWLAD